MARFKSSLQGEFHQGHYMFGVHAGTQCTAISLMFLIMSFLYPIENWQPSHLTTAMFEGTRLHASIISQTGTAQAQQPTYLLHNDLPTFVSFLSDEILVHMDTDQFFGIVGSNPTSGTPGISLIDAIIGANTIASQMLFTVGSNTVAVICTGDCFTLVDSHSRDRNGLPADGGTAISLNFDTVHDLVHMLNHYMQVMPSIYHLYLSK